MMGTKRNAGPKGQIRGQDVARAAVSMVGTPFHHQGRVPGEGLDCVGLAVCAAERLGLAIQDNRRYPPETDGEALRAALAAHCDPVGLEAPLRLGDVLHFRRGRELWHVGIVSELAPLEMVHAWQRVDGGSVRLELVGPQWLARLVEVWRLRGVE